MLPCAQILKENKFLDFPLFLQTKLNAYWHGLLNINKFYFVIMSFHFLLKTEMAMIFFFVCSMEFIRTDIKFIVILKLICKHSIFKG